MKCSSFIKHRAQRRFHLPEKSTECPGAQRIFSRQNCSGLAPTQRHVFFPYAAKRFTGRFTLSEQFRECCLTRAWALLSRPADVTGFPVAAAPANDALPYHDNVHSSEFIGIRHVILEYHTDCARCHARPALFFSFSQCCS